MNHTYTYTYIYIYICIHIYVYIYQLLVTNIFKKQDISTTTTKFRVWKTKYGGTCNKMEEVLREDISGIFGPTECESVPFGKIFYG